MRHWIDLAEAFRNYLDERALRIEANNERFTVLINPTAQQIVRMFEQSRTDVLKGIIIDDTMYWWDGFYAHHGHIIELFDPRGARAPYEIDGVDQRMIIDMECSDRPTLSCDDALLRHPQLHRVLEANLIWFLVPGKGCLTFSQYQEFQRRR